MSFVQCIHLLWKFAGSDTWREITHDNKGSNVFSLLFWTKRCMFSSAWVLREKARESAYMGLYTIAILFCFSFTFLYAFPSF